MLNQIEQKCDLTVAGLIFYQPTVKGTKKHIT